MYTLLRARFSRSQPAARERPDLPIFNPEIVQTLCGGTTKAHCVSLPHLRHEAELLVVFKVRLGVAHLRVACMGGEAVSVWRWARKGCVALNAWCARGIRDSTARVCDCARQSARAHTSVRTCARARVAGRETRRGVCTRVRGAAGRCTTHTPGRQRQRSCPPSPSSGGTHSPGMRA
jgi:hypothetical protein